MKIITVVAAVWQKTDGRYFLAQRAAHKSQGGLWEFPGGKVEAGEHESAALKRELQEELGIDATVNEFMVESTYQYSEELTIILRAYKILCFNFDVILREHQGCGWFNKEEINKLNLSPADLPILKLL
jgi:(d)CTP diphosphatase